MRRIDTLRRPARQESRSISSLADLANYFAFNGHAMMAAATTYAAGNRLSLPSDFAGFISTVNGKSPVVSAAVAKRAALVSQMRFRWRNTRNGKLFGNRDLGVLERPAEDMTRPSLLSRMEYDASYGGNAYVARVGQRLVRLRPDWVEVVYGSNVDPDEALGQWDAAVVGYVFHPDGRMDRPGQLFLAEQVAHWAPEPDPLFPARGLSWVQGVVAEIVADQHATEYRSKFYENGATPNLVFRMDKETKLEAIKAFREMNEAATAGIANAYKNMYLGGGADVTVVGANLDALNFRDSQGGDEARIAVRSAVPAAILGIREGMQGSSLNAGNYTAQRRNWADTWFSPHSASLCAALERIVTVPAEAELVHDPTLIPFLQEDGQDAATIAQTNAQAIRQLVEAGYEPDAAVDAVTTGDMSQLQGRHTNLYSVQLQSPGANQNNGA